ncbi:hypothetical protein BX070DRAFT_235406 [Coemansia spiralis]|nr:hypothetical protein BX070DRAFT_235406 [Coemansia spiralis]
MQKAAKPETSRSMSSMTYQQQSPSLVSLPMLTRPSTTGMGSSLALQSSPGHFKRPRVNSKAAGIGSLFRTKIHSKRNSNGGDSSISPRLDPQEIPEGSWGVGIEYPGAMSPLFTDESLQQLLGSSPQLTSQVSLGPASSTSSSSPMSSTQGLASNGPISPTSTSSRRTKREIAASVLHNSAGPFRRLRSGPASKTMSFPPAVGEPSLYESVATDEFVVVTSDMCPPASLVSSSVISGVSAADANSNVTAAAAAAAAATALASGSGPSASRLSSSFGVFGNGSDNAQYPGRGTSNRGITPRLNKPVGIGSHLPLRARAQTSVSRSTEHLLLRGQAYAESTDSLVRVATPSLSASSSDASLPLGQIPPSTQSTNSSNQMQIRKKAPAPLQTWTPPRPQHNLHLPQNSALGPSTKPPLPRSAYVLSPAPKGTKYAGSPRKVSDCSFSSLEEQRRVSHLVQLDVLSPYTVDRLNTTAAKASERRRRSSVHRTRRSRTNSATSSVNWGLSAMSDMTLMTESARSGHARNMSDTSEFSIEYATSRNHAQLFDFQIQSADSETFWPPGESPLLSDGDGDDDEELERQLEAGGFPTSCSAHFNFEVGRDVGSTCGSPRQHTRGTGNFVTRSADEIRYVQENGFARRRHDILSFMDPSSPLNSDPSQAVTLHLLASNAAGSQNRNGHDAIVETDREFDEDLNGESEISPCIPDYTDYDGSTLTQQHDWQLMNASSSDNEQQSQSQPRRKVRKRRVLPKTLFHLSSRNGNVAGLAADEALYRSSKSSETLLPGPEDATSAELASGTHNGLLSKLGGTNNDVHSRIQRLAAKNARSSANNGVAAASDTVSKNNNKAADKATASVNRATVETAAVMAITPEMQRFLDLEIVPRMPTSIVTYFHIETLGRLSLYSSGDSHSWASARIPCFSLRLIACVERARGLRELSLVNIGLSSIAPAIVKCQGLQRLNMSHNWISTVPGWLARLKRLEHIVLVGNPLRVVSADIVEMRQQLVTLNFGSASKWTMLSRQTPPPRKLSEEDRKQVLFNRIQATASRRMAACLEAPRLDLTHRQHQASIERAQKLLSIYTNTLYSTLREPRNWGHSIALPYPVDRQHWLA